MIRFSGLLSSTYPRIAVAKVLPSIGNSDELSLLVKCRRVADRGLRILRLSCTGIGTDAFPDSLLRVGASLYRAIN